MDIVVLVGRVLFVVLLLVSGFGHVTQTDMVGSYAQAQGCRQPALR